jgi:hypothetical protein
MITSKSAKYNKLKDTRNFLNALPCINAGGCGISAYAMYLWLKKENKLPNDFTFVFLHYSYSEDEFNSNKQVLENGKGQIYAPEHVGIKYKGKILDSSGVVDPQRFGLFFEIPLEKAEDYIVKSLNTNDWNTSFSREMFAPIIEKELGVKFRSDLKRSNKGRYVDWESLDIRF